MSIVDKMKENRLRLFDYVMRREEKEAVRAVMKIGIKEKKGRGKPKWR